MTEEPEKNTEINTHQVTFIAENKIRYSVGETSYIMQCTKTEKDRKYFSCINSRFESSNPKKCDATGILNINNGIYPAKKPHAQCANIEETKVDNSYNIQKNLLLEELSKTPRMTPAQGLHFLIKANDQQKPEQKCIVLNYNQIKHIISNYRNENGIKDIQSFNQVSIYTKDNSLFLRYNSYANQPMASHRTD